MKISVSLNDRHESDRITAFLHQISCYEHTNVELILTKDDLIDRDAPPSIENLRLSSYYLSLVDCVLFKDGDVTTDLYQRDVNNAGIIMRKTKETTHD